MHIELYIMNRIIVILLTLLTSISAKSYDEMLFRNISWSGRYASASVRAFYQDMSGYCWMGVDNQLVRFDGSHFVDYPLPSHGGRALRIEAIGGIDGKFIVAGTDNGLWKLSSSSGTPVCERIFPNEIQAAKSICAIDSVTLAIATSSGLRIYHYPSQKLETVLFEPQRLSEKNNVSCIAISDSILYAAAGGSLYEADLSSRKVAMLVRDLPFKDVTSIAVSNGKVFVGSQTSGLETYDASSGRPLGNIDTGCNVITSLCRGKGSSLYVGTDGNGVIELDSRDLSVRRHLVKRTNRGSELSSNQVYSLMACGHDDLWIGYYQAGADYSLHMGKKFEIYEIPGVFDTHGTTIRTLHLSGNGLALGTRDGFYYIPEGGREVRHIKSPRLRSDMVLAIEYADGLYYIGTYGGGCIMYDAAADQVRDFPALDGGLLKKSHIFSIASDSRGTLWFGTSQGLIAYRNGRIAHHFNVSNSKLPDNSVYDVYFDSSGRGWVGTYKGIAIVDPATETIRTDVFPDGFVINRSVKSIYEDSEKKLYFVSEDGRITVSDTNLTKFYDADPMLFHNAEARSVVEDNDGKIWVTTNNGIFRWDKKKNAARFGFADGIANPIFINGRLVADASGRIWAGNPDGLISFDPEDIEEPVDNSPIYITGIYADDENVAGNLVHNGGNSYSIELESNPHFLKIEFSDFLFTKPEATNYEYSTDGINWHKSPSEMSFAIYDLKWGNNTVILRNLHNKGNDTRLEVTVPYPTWYWVMLVVVMGGVGLLVVVFVRRHSKRKEKLLAATSTEPAGTLPAADAENDSDTSDDGERKEKKKYRSNRFGESDRAEIESKLKKVMAEQKPYLNPDLTAGDLSALIGVSTHRLSQYYSQYLNQSFYDFVNGYRIEEFKSLVKREDPSRYTLTALSEKAGFSSRTTFFRYFKKIEGITPAEYLKNN